MFIESDSSVGEEVKTAKFRKVKKENAKVIDTEFTDVENKDKE